jgi:membrane dipeptidase
MRIRISACTLLAVLPALLTAQDPHMAKARRVLATTPLVDGHNDLPWAIRNAKGAPRDVEAYDLTRRTPGHTDLARLKAGMVGGQFWSVYIPGEIRDSGYAKVQLEQIDIMRQVLRKYPQAMTPALTAADVRAAFARKRIGSLLGMEGGHAIENSLGALRTYYDMGVRYMTLTHNVTLDWADAGNGDQKHGGLTPFGEEVVREMNRLGMLVDLAHTSPCTRAITDVPRNVPDSILRRLPQNGGVLMVTFVPGFLSQKVADYSIVRRGKMVQLQSQYGADTAGLNRELRDWERTNPPVRATIADVADHIDHVRKVAGVNHVGIGSDFDGIDDVVEGLEDVSKYPALFAELSRRGWTEGDLRKLAGENVLRALRQAEQVSARLRRTRGPSTKTIQQLDGRPRM